MSNRVPDKRKNVRKVVIVSYGDRDFQSQEGGGFVVPINPETYSEDYKVKYDERQGQGQEGTDPRYKSTQPITLKLDFTLDGTGTVEGNYYDNLSVQEQVALLKKTVYSKKDDKHRPNFNIVHWGDLAFQCVADSLSVKYTLFDKDGKPLRAKVSVSFLEYVSGDEREARARQSSPDLTHVRTVKEEDRLDLMTYRIFNDSNLFLQIAKVNNLTSLRMLSEGQEIVFPPLDRKEI